MKKLEKRAILCLVLAGMLLLGLAFFIFQYITKGDDWASFAANRHLYQNGNLIRGSIYDVDGDLLLENSEEGTTYSDSAAVRRATIHAVGDVDGNIGNGAVTSFADKLTGYNLITGTYSLTGRGRNLYLSIDDEVCRVANEALDGRSGRAGDPSGWQEDQEAGKDMEYFRAMYPEKMKRLQRSISDLCDTIDYEGSILYDEYPDRVGVRRLCGEIYRRELQEDAGEAEAEWMKAAIEVLFCHEICARRIRRRTWRKRYW